MLLVSNTIAIAYTPDNTGHLLTTDPVKHLGSKSPGYLHDKEDKYRQPQQDEPKGSNGGDRKLGERQYYQEHTHQHHHHWNEHPHLWREKRGVTNLSLKESNV